MSRSRLIRTLALSVGVAGYLSSSLSGDLLAGQCDRGCDGTKGQCQCQCTPGPGLLDSLDQFAAKLVKKSAHRPSILSAFKLKSAQCDEPACGLEPACGTEPTCGTEPVCGCEPTCGTEPACGCESHGAAEASCGCAGSGYSHAAGPIHYPPQMQSRVQ
ncbi:MAG: hypothetical protein IT423_14055, partial [Pirellulaceae bacterium]|nr:hypothetical protein [Pirellulaceae bacterium]